MIYIIGLIVGLLNGLFASGAGQILVVYLVFILKNDTHKSRALSIAIISISSIFALFGYFRIINFEISKIIVTIVIAIVGGIIGTKLMKKMNANILNLISGILIVALTLYKWIAGGG